MYSEGGAPDEDVVIPTTSASSKPHSFQSYTRPQPEVLDEPARKRRCEADALVKSLKRPKTFSCGISYQGDANEKEYSDGVKEFMKKHLPALKNHRHIFRYMAWTTQERIECEHCKQCPNEYS